MSFVKAILKQWLALVLIIVYVLATHFKEVNETKLVQENKQLTKEVKVLKIAAVENAKLIDSLKDVDVVYVDKIKLIKQTVIEELRVLDSLPHSGIESYFAERYNSKDSVTFYPESVARATATDLVNYDACKHISAEQENRINNFLAKDKLYEKQIGIKDTIISKQDVIISNQNSIINSSKRPKFGTYIGMMTQEATLTNPNIYGKVMYSTKKINLGAQYNIKSTVLPAYNLILEYKLF